MKPVVQDASLDPIDAGKPTLARPFNADIAIVGAGPVGLALAGSLARRSATQALRIIVIDARDASASQQDPRVLALSYGSRVLLEPLGWPVETTPIERIHVSQRGHFGRSIIDRHEHNLSALGYVVRYGAIADSLRQGVQRAIAAGAHIAIREHCRADSIVQDADGVTLHMNTDSTAPQTLRARLVIHAEGGLFSAAESAARQASNENGRAHPSVRSRDYGQTAIVGAVRSDAPLPRVAWERFTEDGPIALLPLAESGGRMSDYALVWCQSPTQADARMRLSDADFVAALGQAFGTRVGTFTHIEGRAQFALGLNSRAVLVDRRAAAIGNAAQTLHPVAGQGLNLGLRDAQALAAALAEHGPTAAALADFAARRRIDRYVTIGMTDALARGFTVDFPPLSALRGAALAALDLLPGAKSLLARQMMFGQRR